MSIDHSMVLGLDPGLMTGIAAVGQRTSHANIWDLKRGDHPLHYLHDLLSVALEHYRPGLLVYEEPVARGMAARSLNRQLGVIILTAEIYGVPHYPCNPSTLKKFATGNGRASKEEMLEAGERRGMGEHDHNAIDALWLAVYGHEVVRPNL